MFSIIDLFQTDKSKATEIFEDITLNAADTQTEDNPNVIYPDTGSGTTVWNYLSSRNCLYQSIKGTVVGVVNFPEVNITNYETLKLYYGNYWSVLPGNIIWKFYKNDGSYTENSMPAAVSEQTSGNNQYKNEGYYAEIPLTALADEDGNVSSVIVSCYDGGKNTDGMSVYLYGGVIKAIASGGSAETDYELLINGTDIMPGEFKGDGADYINGVTHTGTEKIYANSFKRGTAVSLDFGTAIDTAKFKTLTLRLSIFGVSGDLDYYVGIYKGNTADISAAEPVGRFALKNTTDKLITGCNTINLRLSDYADTNGKVESLILYHNTDTRVGDYGVNLFIWKGNVSVSETEYSVNWLTNVTDIKFTKSENDVDDRLDISFDTAMFNPSSENAIVEDLSSFSGLLSVIAVNGNVLSVDSVEKIIIGYNNSDRTVAVYLKSGTLLNDNDDTIDIRLNTKIYSTIEDADCVFVVNEEKQYIFPKVAAAGETITLMEYDTVDGVTAEYSETQATVKLHFTSEIGNIDGCDVGDYICFNESKVSETDITFEISPENENVLILTVPNSLFKTEAQNMVSVLKGFYSQNLYISEDVVFSQYSEGENNWFIETGVELFVLWFDDCVVNDNIVKFSIKTTSSWEGEDLNFSSSSALDKITINGKKVSELVADDETEITINNAYINFSFSREVSGITKTENDIIIIEKGFALPSGGSTFYETKYNYSTLWNNFIVVSDVSSIENDINIVNIEMVEKASSSTDESLVLHISFSLPISYRYYTCMQRDVSRLSDAFSGIATSNPSEFMLSQLAYYGVVGACLDRISYDGMMLNDWLEAYKGDNIEKWQDLVNIEFLGLASSGQNYAFCKRIQITLNLGADNVDMTQEHTLEFEAGLMTPLLQKLDKTVKYIWNPTLSAWQGNIDNIADVGEDENTSDGDKSGCGSSIDYKPIFAVVMILVTVIGLITVINKKEKVRRGKKQ